MYQPEGSSSGSARPATAYRSMMNTSTRACTTGPGRALAVPANSDSGRSCGRAG
jgi:hypothetical protein